MSVKRVIDSGFWTKKEVLEHYSVEDRYFLLYLMSNPHCTQVGIYRLPKRVMSLELGYDHHVIDVLLQRFQSTYQLIAYSEATQEISLLHSLSYSILKGGRPVLDLLIKELEEIEDDQLIQHTYTAMQTFWRRSRRDIDKQINHLFEEECLRRQLIDTSELVSNNLLTSSPIEACRPSPPTPSNEQTYLIGDHTLHAPTIQQDYYSQLNADDRQALEALSQQYASWYHCDLSHFQQWLSAWLHCLIPQTLIRILSLGTQAEDPLDYVQVKLKDVS